MNNQFGPESTNPRMKRAYAHATRDKALSTGAPEDKVHSLEAGLVASRTSKGEELGKQALSAIRNKAGIEINHGEPLRTVHQHVDLTTDLHTDARRLVSEIEGPELGVTARVEKPEDTDSYERAVRRLDAHRVVNMEGMLKNDINGKTVPADTPRTESEIQNVAEYHQGLGSSVVDISATHDTGNFYRTVDAVTKPH
ncbi:MAG: hypothetical protein ACI9T8_000266 [Candidatus Saccharimonadales bacterium]|jgi:hypothetical protein